MKSPKKNLLDLVSHFAKDEGYNPTPVKGVDCLKISTPHRPTKSVWRSCFAIIIQGTKEVVVENHVYSAREYHYTATPVDLPTVSSIPNASREKPFLALLIDFNSDALPRLTRELEKASADPTPDSPEVIFVGAANSRMIESTIRLVELFERPKDARILGPLIVQELFYYLLTSENGQALRNFLRSGSNMQRVAKALHKIKDELTEKINVSELAKVSSMSRSLFFQNFKKASSMSPIQYQKKLRLIEARRRMSELGETAEKAAFSVGYVSVSQFSREYLRMFGNSPAKDVAKLKKQREK